MVTDKVAHLLHDARRKPQPSQYVIRHGRRNGFVLVKRALAVRKHTECLRLPDVVKQGGQSHAKILRWRTVTGEDGVSEHIEAVPALLLHSPAAVQLRQHHPENPGFRHQDQPGRREASREHLGQLVLHALRSDTAKPPGTPAHALHGARLHDELQLRGEPAGTKGPEGVLREPPQWIADGSNDAMLRVRSAPVRIDELAVFQIHGHSVDGEVSSFQIFRQGRAEADRVRPSAVGVPSLDAERGHLHRLAVHDDGHGAVLDAGGDGSAKQPHDGLRPSVRSDIVVLRRDAQHHVPHGTAHQVRTMAGLGKDPRNGPELSGDGKSHDVCTRPVRHRVCQGRRPRRRGRFAGPRLPKRAPCRAHQKKEQPEAGCSGGWRAAALLQELQHRLRFLVRLGKHSRGRLKQNLILHELYHLARHVGVPDPRLGSLQVLGAD